MGAATDGVAVVEDVRGTALDALARSRAVVRDEGAWADPAALRRAADGAAVLVVRNRTRVDRALLEDLPALRLVARAGVGLDNIDVAAADDLGVVVAAAAGANAVSVAEHALGLALAVARGTVASDAAVRRGAWDRAPGLELAGGTWGLLSFGATARATGRLARALGLQVLAHDPHVRDDDPDLRALGARLVGLEELAAGSDVLSVHAPATPATRHLVGAPFLARMRAGAVLVSVGRGEVVDEAALADALRRGHLRGAGLDVREQEPPVAGPLDGLPGVVLTPHVAGITGAAQERVVAALCRDAEAVLGGGEARGAVGRHRSPARGRVPSWT
ncbi:NAD(P)-dependent oxidoreductase [Vallicoccus soli]|uniref:Phosphoglycerate dehydrogenase n=1 Tax=Vallicoccus soli TaxID=2339232 RepID=A0A3A3ZM15_9ACTN|nr:NAD(P)-dependent oxidoreductase [Vallicoccus soli]RJK97561.1 phosphoglycerate dehydrogenase [Vallicoccus soli]